MLFIFIGLAVLVFIILALFLAYNLGKQESLQKKAVVPIATTTKPDIGATASTTGIRANPVLGHAAVGGETEATATEKKAIGVLDFINIKVLRRDEQGKILSFAIEPNPNDTVDSDNDGIPDKQEKLLGTNPDNSDTDGDGVSDYQELLMGTDPKISNDFSKK